MIDEDIKKTADNLIKDITKNFKFQLKLKDINEKYEMSIDGYDLTQNKKKGYIGRFFDVLGFDLIIWAGYDNATEHFCISFYSEKYKEQLVSALEDLHFNYSAEYISFDNEGYWYSIFVDTPYKNNKNRQLKSSPNEFDYKTLEKDIKNIIKKFKRKIAMKNKTLLTRKWPLIWLNIISSIIICDILVFAWLKNNFDIFNLIILGISLVVSVVLSIFYYRATIKSVKLKLLERIVTNKNLKNISQDNTKTTKNENSSDATTVKTVTETVDATTFNSKSKVLISAIEAIKDL